MPLSSLVSLSQSSWQLENVKFKDKQTEVEVYALKFQAVYGDYQQNINHFDFKKEKITEQNL